MSQNFVSSNGKSETTWKSAFWRIFGAQVCTKTPKKLRGCRKEKAKNRMKSGFFTVRENPWKGFSATHNPEVVGSNPSPATTLVHRLWYNSLCTFLLYLPLASGWVLRFCTHALYFLAYLKIRQKVFNTDGTGLPKVNCTLPFSYASKWSYGTNMKSQKTLLSAFSFWALLPGLRLIASYHSSLQNATTPVFWNQVCVFR